MNGNGQDLGTIRIITARAEIVEIREGNDLKWAIFRIPVTNGDHTSLVQIADSRPETVAAAKTALKVSEAFFKARGPQKKALEDERVKTLKDARAALNSGVADAMIERTVVGGGKREKVNIALESTEDKSPNHVLAIVHTVGSWQRHPGGENRPFSYMKKEKGEPVYYQLHTVVANSPVYLWSLDPDGPTLFKISLAGGLEAKIFEEYVLERFDGGVSASAKPPIPVTQPQPKSSGKSKLVNGEHSRVRIAETDAGQALAALAEELEEDEGDKRSNHKRTREISEE